MVAVTPARQGQAQTFAFADIAGFTALPIRPSYSVPESLRR